MRSVVFQRLAVLSMVVVLCAPAVASARAARHKAAVEDPALVDATAAWKALSVHPKHRTRRDLWLSVIDGLHKIAMSPRSPETRATAILRAGEAAEEMAGISRNLKDATRAMNLYGEMPADAPPAIAKEGKSHATALAQKHHLAISAVVTQKLAPPKEMAEAPKPAPAPPPVPAPASVPAPQKAAPTDQPEKEESLSGELSQLIDSADDLKPPPQDPAELAALEQLRKTALVDKTVSLSEQVGLKVHKIIVDAGHGGYDTGAIGPTGIREKDVTLAIARLVAKDLRARGFEVVLTRDSDVFVPLEERTAIANKEHGDLFVSIHANASPKHQQSGVETYALNVASNRYAMRLAARENATSKRGVSDLQYVLADLATRANSVDSDKLASCVQSAVVGGVAKRYGKPKDNGVKHALFYVLLGARMPAVLVETQFISNRQQEKRLASPGYQTQVAKSITAGVDRFVERRTQVASLVP